MPTRVHFEIQPTDPDVLRRFCGSLSGWTFERWVAAGGPVAMPADDLPGIGRPASLVGPEGNTFGLLQPA